MDQRATRTHTDKLIWALEIPVTVMLQNHSEVVETKRSPQGVCMCVCVLSTKPTKILPAIKKCSALALHLIFPRPLELQTSRAIVISSTSVSIWMPESQLRLRLIESAPGPSHAGTQMSSAWGGKEWRDGGRGAQGLNKRSWTSKSQTDCSRNNGWLQYWCKLNHLSKLIHSVQ